MSRFAPLPEPPYYAVIFSSQMSDDPEGYSEAAEQMVALAEQQPGFLGVESTRDAEGFGITISYWKDEVSITNWRENLDHTAARQKGRTKWYAHFRLRVARVERAYQGPPGT